MMRDGEKVRAKFRGARVEARGFTYYIRAIERDDAGKLVMDHFLGMGRSERDAWAEAAKKIWGEV